VSVTETADPGDLPLVRRAQAGDFEAFGELVDRNRRAVFRAALAALGSPAEADDVAQDAFVTAFRKLDSFRGEAAFRTWLLAITWRKAIDRRKSIGRWVQRLATPHTTDEFGEEQAVVDRLPAAVRSQEESLMTADLHRHVRKLIGSLPRKLRDPLLLVTSGDHSYDEVARMLDVPVGTLKWRVSEARRVLKTKLAAQGYSREYKS
jgi:RNA polymerase sigma-70 factor (ECF subfamily)